MRIARFAGIFLLLLGSLLAVLARGGEYRLANGNTLKGEIVSADEDGLVVKLEVGEFSRREAWVSMSQETLRELFRDAKYRELVEPFIELAPEELQAREKKKEVVIREVAKKFERPERKPGLFGSFLSPIGFLILGMLMLGNLFAAYEVALFRGHSVPIVCGLSVVLPLLGPIIFLSIPGANATPAPPEPEPAQDANSLAVPTTSERPGSLSLASAEKSPAAAAATQPQIYQRGEHTFNRRFFESKFPGFFRVVISEAEKDLVIVVRTPKAEYVGRRISRISMNEMHLQLQSGAETNVAFSEVTTVILKHKDARV